MKERNPGTGKLISEIGLGSKPNGSIQLNDDDAVLC